VICITPTPCLFEIESSTLSHPFGDDRRDDKISGKVSSNPQIPERIVGRLNLTPLLGRAFRRISMVKILLFAFGLYAIAQDSVDISPGLGGLSPSELHTTSFRIANQGETLLVDKKDSLAFVDTETGLMDNVYTMPDGMWLANYNYLTNSQFVVVSLLGEGSEGFFYKTILLSPSGERIGEVKSIDGTPIFFRKWMQISTTGQIMVKIWKTAEIYDSDKSIITEVNLEPDSGNGDDWYVIINEYPFFERTIDYKEDLSSHFQEVFVGHINSNYIFVREVDKYIRVVGKSGRRYSLFGKSNMNLDHYIRPYLYDEKKFANVSSRNKIQRWIRSFTRVTGLDSFNSNGGIVAVQVPLLNSEWFSSNISLSETVNPPHALDLYMITDLPRAEKIARLEGGWYAGVYNNTSFVIVYQNGTYTLQKIEF
jgi:hypothetical protein